MIIYKHFNSYIDEHISPYQHGFWTFRTKKSTLTNLIDPLSYSSPFFKSCQQFHAINFDLAKAFDKDYHELLLHELRFYGVSSSNGFALIFTVDFLK